MKNTNQVFFKFPRELRVLRGIEFSNVFAKPLRIGNKAFTVLARKNNLNHPRLGLAIAKKQVKLAVKRNLIKRKVRESFRLTQRDIPNCDFIVMVRRDINDMDRVDISKALDHIWRKANKICDG
ncbi:MAG: ribonuclease P protein component [Kangiellaceae bacterium]|jgi:ribonuclease P protein component|nr:ribonuclease P protein component [Kangiellaceae bacterium]